MITFSFADHPRDLIDEILLQLQKQQDQPETNPVLAQMTESHLNQIISDVFFGEASPNSIVVQSCLEAILV